MAYKRGTFHRTTTVSSTEPAEVDEHGLQFSARYDPHGSWTTELHVVRAILGPGGRSMTAGPRAADRARREMLEDLKGWVARAPRLACGWGDPTHTATRR